MKDDGGDHKDKMYAPGGDNEKLQEMFSDDCWHGVRIWKEGSTIHGEIWNGDFTEQIGYVEPGGEREGRITNVDPSGLKKFVVLNQAPFPDDKEFGYEGCLDDLIVAKYVIPEPIITLGEPRLVIIHDSYCYSESKTDFKLNSTYLIGDYLYFSTSVPSWGSLFSYLASENDIDPVVDGFSIPVLDYLIHQDMSIEVPVLLKKFWIQESLIQPIDTSSRFTYHLNVFYDLLPRLLTLFRVHWLIFGGLFG